MGKPILNSIEEFRSVKYYRDSTDKNLWYFGPSKSVWTKTRVDVAGHIVWNARLDLIPIASDQDTFKVNHGNCKVAPLAVGAEKASIELYKPIQTPHKASFKVIPGMPYPMITFSATLDKADNSCQQIDDEIRKRIDNNTLLLGSIEWDVVGLDVAFDGNLVFDLKSISSVILQASKNGVVHEKPFSEALLQEIATSIRSIVQITNGNATPDDMVIIANIVYGKLSHDLVAIREEIHSFDQGFPHYQYKLRVPLEFSKTPLTQPISITREVSGRISLIF